MGNTFTQKDIDRAKNDGQLSSDISFIKHELTEIKEKLEVSYVTKAEFEPIKKTVYGMIGLILTSVLVMVLNLVVNK